MPHCTETTATARIIDAGTTIEVMILRHGWMAVTGDMIENDEMDIQTAISQMINTTVTGGITETKGTRVIVSVETTIFQHAGTIVSGYIEMTILRTTVTSIVEMLILHNDGTIEIDAKMILSCRGRGIHAGMMQHLLATLGSSSDLESHRFFVPRLPCHRISPLSCLRAAGLGSPCVCRALTGPSECRCLRDTSQVSDARSALARLCYIRWRCLKAAGLVIWSSLKGQTAKR